MGFWVGISNRRNLWLTEDLTMSEGVPFRLNNYMSGTRFEVILSSLRLTDINYVEYNYGLLQIIQVEEAWNINMPE